MSNSTEIIKDGFIHIMSEEGRQLYNSLMQSGLLFEQLSVIFNEYAIASVKGTQVATKSDIISLREAIFSLSSRLSEVSIGNPSAHTGIPNMPLVENDLGGIAVEESEPIEPVIVTSKKKKSFSFNQLAAKSAKQN